MRWNVLGISRVCGAPYTTFQTSLLKHVLQSVVHVWRCGEKWRLPGRKTEKREDAHANLAFAVRPKRGAVEYWGAQGQPACQWPRSFGRNRNGQPCPTVQIQNRGIQGGTRNVTRTHGPFSGGLESMLCPRSGWCGARGHGQVGRGVNAGMRIRCVSV